MHEPQVMPFLGKSHGFDLSEKLSRQPTALSTGQNMDSLQWAPKVCNNGSTPLD